MSRDQSGGKKTNTVLMDEHSSSSQSSQQGPSQGHVTYGCPLTLGVRCGVTWGAQEGL